MHVAAHLRSSSSDNGPAVEPVVPRRARHQHVVAPELDADPARRTGPAHHDQWPSTQPRGIVELVDQAKPAAIPARGPSVVCGLRVWQRLCPASFPTPIDSTPIALKRTN